jgi:hypothetical protein
MQEDAGFRRQDSGKASRFEISALELLPESCSLHPES